MKSVGLLPISEKSTHDCTLLWATVTQSEYSGPDKGEDQQGKFPEPQTVSGAKMSLV
jgi:hypothetical protein